MKKPAAPARVATPRVKIPKETISVRAVVTTWHGRCLKVQATGDLLRALQALEPNEASLYAMSPHAPRLLTCLRRELANPRHLNSQP